jgi:hypothetical protein
MRKTWKKPTLLLRSQPTRWFDQALAMMSASASSQKKEQAGIFSFRRTGPSPRSLSENRSLVMRFL